MNVYDAAHNLAKTIRESEEYLTFKELDKEIHKEQGLREMIDDFQNRQLELQTMQMMGQELNEEKLKEAQAIFEKLNGHSVTSKYFQAELRLNQMMGDISKILGDVMDFRSDYKESN